MAQDELLGELKRAMDEHRRLGVPKAGTCDLHDADVDLFEEDAYIFGLADAALTGRQTSEKSIRLDKSIDERLTAALKRAEPTIAIAERFKVYRASVIRLAQLASKILKLPIVEWSRLDE